MCGGRMSQNASGGRKTAFRSCFFPLPYGVLGLTLRSSGLAASAFHHPLQHLAGPHHPSLTDRAADVLARQVTPPPTHHHLQDTVHSTEAAKSFEDDARSTR